MKRRLLVRGLLIMAIMFGSAVTFAPDGFLDAVCAGLGPDSPLWSVLGCTTHNGPQGS